METVSNNILIADDDRTNMIFIKEGIRNLPYNFVFVENGTSALDKILNEKFDLFLLDVMMPGLSGFEVIEHYKVQRPDSDTPFIFLTGNDDKEAILKGLNLGAVDYITKPYCIQEIRKRITIHHGHFKSRKELDHYAKKMEQIAQARAEKLIHADRLSTIGMIAAGIMHEINNPATFISGNIQIIQNKLMPLVLKILEESDMKSEKKVKIMLEELPKMCEGVLNGVARIKSITDGLKAFSRSHKTEFHSISLNKCVKNALLFCETSVPKSISINFDENESLGFFLGDCQQIEQVIINLIVNSSHAIEGQSSPEISILCAQENEWLTLKVRDNGSGIPSDVLEQIWNPFFTTKPKGKGTGLGLSICKEMIEAHNGKMEYTGELNKGAEFTIYIPKGEVAS